MQMENTRPNPENAPWLPSDEQLELILVYSIIVNKYPLLPESPIQT